MNRKDISVTVWEVAAHRAYWDSDKVAKTCNLGMVAEVDGERVDSNLLDASKAVRNLCACRDPLPEAARGTLNTYGRNLCCKWVRHKLHNQGLLLQYFH